MKKKLTYETVCVTPEMAKEWLDKYNTRNRPVSNIVVRNYVSEMVMGNWKTNPVDPITFAEDGTLLNGQHRLVALVRYGHPVNMVVCRNAPRDTFIVLDRGKKRSNADIFAIEKGKRGSILPAIISRYLALREKSYYSRSNSPKASRTSAYSGSIVLEEYNRDTELYDDIAAWAEVLRHKGVFPSSISGGLAVYLIKAKGHEKENVKRFFELIFLGSDNEMYRYVKRKIEQERKQARITRSSWSPFRTFNLLAVAWSRHLKGKDLDKIIPLAPDKIYEFE